ncbi:ankycorbin isoform X2 [Xenopus laevis]|uniref:Ankycorbin isoform X2 n=1 Tax=Xenopus laevis TaxID=8355 RepID=A0A8J1L7S1_XENLA|nr:ankycorbin isoform X2 [Xenopus laevis]
MTTACFKPWIMEMSTNYRRCWGRKGWWPRRWTARGKLRANACAVEQNSRLSPQDGKRKPDEDHSVVLTGITPGQGSFPLIGAPARGFSFHLAAAKGNVDCLRVMLTHGIDVSAQDISGHSALHLAVRNNHIECVKRLLQSKCPVDSTDNAGKSPMHYAASNGCVASVQILCDQKCPTNIKDLEGNTPLLVAVLHGHIEVCKYLLDHRADVNVKDANGRTPLMLACESSNFNMVDMFVRNGADLRLTDSLGHDALHFSRLSGNSQIINLLVSKMSQEPGIVSPTKPVQHDQVTKLSTERSGTPKKRKAPPPPITPLQSDVSSPRSSISTPMSAQGQVFFPDQGGKDEITSSRREYRDRLSDSIGADSLLDESSEAEHQEAIALLQAKIVSLTSQNKELQEKLQAKLNSDISCDSYHSTQTDLNLSNVSTQESTSPTIISENTDISFESQPEASISEHKLRQLEKTIDDMQLKLNESEAEREKLEAQIQSTSSRLQQSINEESVEDGSDLEVQPYGAEDERQDKKQKASLQRMSNVEQEEPKGMSEESHQKTMLMLEELETLRRNYKNILSESDRKDNEMKELQYQVDLMTANMANMVTLEKLEEVEKSYISLKEQVNQEKTQLRDTYEKELKGMKKLQKELESRMEKASSDEDKQDKEAVINTIEELNKQVSELTLAYREAQAELGKARENAQEVSCDFIQKEEHVKLLQEVIDGKQQVENDLASMASQHAKALEEACELKQRLQEELRDSPVVAEYMQVIATLRDNICSLEAEREELRVGLSSQESKLRALEEDVLHEKTVVQETMVTRKVFEELQASLEEEIGALSSEIRNLLKEKEKLSNESAQVKLELTQVKGDKDLILSQLNTRELEIDDYRIRHEKAQEDLLELKRFSENTSKIEEDKDKKINELSKEVSKLKEALNSLSQLSLSTSTPKRQSQQLEALQQQVKQLQSQLIETKKQHQEIVSVYRMHLLYAVQGQMDEDVQKVLKQILMMCKSQPQKM